MATALRLFSLLLVLTLSGLIASAQAPTGTPPFGSFSGGPDVIDLRDLNVHLTIPVLHKAGRGTDFYYDLTYDSSVWYPVTSGSTTSWQSVGNWGWASQSSALTGSVPIARARLSCWVTPPGGLPVKDYYWQTDYAGYTDPAGTFHPASVTTTEGDPSCDGGPVPPVYTGSAQAVDGSGYTLTVNEQSNPSVVVIGLNGVQINNTGSSSLSTIIDRNGNKLTTGVSGSTTTFTDTLNQTPLTVSGSALSPPVTYTYTAPSGASAPFKVNYTQYTVQTWFQVSGIADTGATSVSLVSSIVLPDNSQYSFTYEPTPAAAGCTPLAGTSPTGCVTGRIASVTLPTGGQITYSYSGGNNGILSDGSAATLTRQTPDGTWTYAQVKGASTDSTTTITDPQNNQTFVQFQGIYETARDIYQGSIGGSPLRTVHTCYHTTDSPPCTASSVTLPITYRGVYTVQGGQESARDEFYNSYGLPTQIDEHDYGPAPQWGPLIKRTLISYASLGNGIVDMPASITICSGSGTDPNCNGSGTRVAQTTFGYDQTAAVSTGGTTPQQVPISGSRGNVTNIWSYTNASSYLTKTFTYFDTGNVQTSTDVNNAQTTYNYADATSTCGNAFATSVSEPLGLSRSMTWNCIGGVQLTATDENSQPTTTAYTDPYFWRPASVTDATGATTNFTYTGQTKVESVLNVAAGSAVDKLTVLDGLGRVSLQQTRQAPGSTNFDTVETDYDSLGRPSRTSLPYVGTEGQTNPSGPGPTNLYDALGRITSVSDSGGGSTTYSYNSNDVFVTLGPAPTGENAKRRQMEYDAIGHLTSVCEVTTGTPAAGCGQNTAQTGYATNYTYDPLGNLTGVTQNAQAPAAQQHRAYVYDWFSRMTSQTLPESGTTNYAYDSYADANCTLTSAGDRVSRSDAAGNVTCYFYDVLHRVTKIVYPLTGPQSRVAVGHKYFTYDAATVNGVVMSNAKGRLAEAYTPGGCDTCPKITDAGFSYTNRGEVSDTYQSTAYSNGYYHVSQTYWPNGAPNQLSTNISGLPTFFTYGVDSEGRTNSTSVPTPGQSPVTSTSYNVFSQPTQVTFGSGDQDVFGYDPNSARLNQYQFKIGATPQSVTGTLTWNANSTLQKLVITDPFNSANNQTCKYGDPLANPAVPGYDDLSRLISADCAPAASQTFSYDPFGNINKSGSPYSFNAQYSPSSNHMTSIGSFTPTYDGNGNVTNDGLHTYTWDVEARPVVTDGVTVFYDALNRMVDQVRAGPAYTSIVYSPTGDKLALMNRQTLQEAFISLPGGATAVYTGAGLDHYRHPDWLGSTRLTSSPTQTVLSSVAYAPFGEPYAQFGTPDLSFTTQNQDTVGAEYDFLARQYGIQGRWPSPDPLGTDAADLSDPQSLNLYAYVRNSALNYVDPQGLYYVCIGGVLYYETDFFVDGKLDSIELDLEGYCDSGGTGGGPTGDYGGGGSGGDSGGGGDGGNSSGTPQQPSSNPSYKTCISSFYNSGAGKATEFLSPISLLPGWNPGAWTNVKHWAKAIGSKIALTEIALAGGNTGEIVNYSVTAGTATATVTELSGPVSAGITALSKITPPAVATAAAYDALTHAGCAVQAQIGGPITPPIR